MKEPQKIYVGAAVFFDHVADDGWPGDAGLWPVDGGTSRSVDRAAVNVDKPRHPSLPQRLQFLLFSGNRMPWTSFGARAGKQLVRANGE
jgi:hypothetical protein